MSGDAHIFPPSPDKIVDFIKLQVTDAALDVTLFPDGIPADTYSVLFALGLLSVIPPVPNNRATLDTTFTYMQQVLGPITPSEFIYNDIVTAYNRYLGVFQKSAAMPKKDPFGNPYEQVAKAASYQLGFSDDGVRIFHLTTWMTHYCKDAISLFFARQAEQTAPPKRSMPSPENAYAFVSRHVNNTVTDPTFFTDAVPANATEVFTSLYLLIALFVPLQDGQLVYKTLDYTNSLLAKNHYPPMFFEKIVQGMERLSAVYEDYMDENTEMPTNLTFESMADEAIRMMGIFPDNLLRYNIVAYFPVLIFDALEVLYPEADKEPPARRVRGFREEFVEIEDEEDEYEDEGEEEEFEDEDEYYD